MSRPAREWRHPRTHEIPWRLERRNLTSSGAEDNLLGLRPSPALAPQVVIAYWGFGVPVRQRPGSTKCVNRRWLACWSPISDRSL